MEFQHVLRRRRMVRNYRTDPVPQESLERVVHAFRRAPSAGNSQGQHLVVVTDAATRGRIAELAREPEYVRRGFDGWLSNAPVHLILCTRETDYRRRYSEADKAGGAQQEWPVPYWHVDAGAAMMAILLAAVDEGLAAGFFGFHRLQGLKDLLGIPHDVAVIGALTLGYAAPDRPSTSAARPKRADTVHHERWQAPEVHGFDPTLPIERAWTPPAEWFREPAFLQRDRDTVFRRSWLAVGRVDQVAEPGQFFTGTFLDEPYVVVRDADGTLRAHANACRHHAAAVASGEGRCERFVCPYHGWTYRLDGRLQRAPGLGRVEDFDRDRFGLHPLATDTLGPFVFLHFGTPEGPVREVFPDLHELLAGAGYERLRFRERRTWEIACNWKVYVDNYLDGGYHVSQLHGDLAAQLELGSYRTDMRDRYSVQSCGAGDSERLAGGALYAWLYPNFMVNRYGPMMDTNLVIPLSHDRTLTVFDYYFEPDATDEFVAQSLEASAQVQAEDVFICESVQVGLGSRGYGRGRYAQVEAPDLQFHRLLAADYAP